MADKANKLAVLEGDFASLCDLGFPLSLSKVVWGLTMQYGLQSLPVVAFRQLLLVDGQEISFSNMEKDVPFIFYQLLMFIVFPLTVTVVL